MTTLALKDYKLCYHYYVIDKHRPTLLMIHDIGMNQEMWQLFLPNLEKKYNFLTYDFYGHGKTAGNRDSHSINQLLHELSLLILHLGLDRVHIAGCRFGAILALEFAIREPERVASLILMSFPFYLRKDEYDRENAVNLQLLQLDYQLYEEKYIMESVFPATLSKSRLVARALRQVSRDHIISPVAELIRLSQSPGFDLIGKLREVRQPVLFMHGECDPVFPTSLAMLLSKYVPNSQFMVIPEASMLIPLDQPEFAADLLNRFMRSDKSPAPLLTGTGHFVNAAKSVIERRYEDRNINRRVFQLSVMSGKTHVFWNGKKLIGNWDKRHARELILFIILNGGTAKRDTIIDAFTPDLDIDQARNHLRVQLNYLNQLLRSQEDPALHNFLTVSRDSVAFNAHAESDIGEYMRHIEYLLWSDDAITTRSAVFLSFLEDYHPDRLDALNFPWIRELNAKIRDKLSQIMMQILSALRKERNLSEMLHVLERGKKIEPYKNFCDNWMKKLG